MNKISCEKIYWLNGKLKYEISYANGKIHGLRKWWNLSGELTEAVLYNNGVLLMVLKSISTPIHSTKKIRFK